LMPRRAELVGEGKKGHVRQGESEIRLRRDRAISARSPNAEALIAES